MTSESNVDKRPYSDNTNNAVFYVNFAGFLPGMKIKPISKYMFVNFKKKMHVVDYYLIVYSISFSDGLFYRIVNRTTKWCIDNSGKEPYCLLKTLARFFLDDEHDFVLEMAPRNFHRIKVPFMNSVVKNYFC